jgi:hypothetical protein
VHLRGNKTGHLRQAEVVQQYQNQQNQDTHPREVGDVTEVQVSIQEGQPKKQNFIQVNSVMLILILEVYISDRSNSTKSRTVDKSVKSSKSKRNENGGTSVSAKSSSMTSRHSQPQSQAQSKSTASRRTDDILDDLVLEEKDSNSVITEVLCFGEVNETKSISHSTMSDKSWSNTKDAKSSTSASETTMSVAEKRRRKAMAAAGNTSLETSSVAKSTSSSRDTQLTSNAKKVVEDKPVKEEQPQAKPEDDPPLVLFNSDDESDQSEDESAKRAIQKKGKKKKGGFMKKPMGIGVSSIYLFQMLINVSSCRS